MEITHANLCGTSLNLHQMSCRDGLVLITAFATSCFCLNFTQIMGYLENWLVGESVFSYD